MSRKSISNGDLTALIDQELRADGSCPLGLPIAVVKVKPASPGWIILVGKRRGRSTACIKNIADVQARLQKLYKLRD